MKKTNSPLIMARFWLVALVVIGALTPAAASAADPDPSVVIFLRHGKQIRGDLLSLTSKKTSVLAESGRTFGFATADILRLDSSVPYAVDTEAGEQLKGRISIRRGRRDSMVFVEGDERHELRFADVVSVAPVSLGDEQPTDLPKDGSEDKQAISVPVHPQGDKAPGEAKGGGSAAVARAGRTAADEGEDVHSLFLKHMSVLLVRREAELEIGLSYLYSRWFDPTQNRLTYSRYAQMSAVFSFGLTSFIQAAISAPLVFHQEHTYQEKDSREAFSQNVSPGNVAAALSVQVVRSTALLPDVMISSGLSAPVGSESANTETPSGKISSGFWSAEVGISLIKTSDPLSIVVGASYSHAFDRTAGGQRVQLGDFWGYLFGVGFAVNSKVSLSANVHGGWQAPNRLNGIRTVDTEAEPMAVGAGLIYAIGNSWYLSPGVTFPINIDGDTVVLKLPIAHRF